MCKTYPLEKSTPMPLASVLFIAHTKASVLNYAFKKCTMSCTSAKEWNFRLVFSVSRGWAERLEQAKMLSELSLLRKDTVWRTPNLLGGTRIWRSGAPSIGEDGQNYSTEVPVSILQGCHKFSFLNFPDVFLTFPWRKTRFPWQKCVVKQRLLGKLAYF